MRAATLLIVMALAACAAQPPAPAAAPSAASGQAAGSAAAPGASAAPGSAGAPSSAAASATEPEGKRIALAQKMHLKMVNQNGEEVFCKSSMVTGSHIRTEMRCYTADEMDHLEEQTQRDIDQLNKVQSLSTNPGMPLK